MNNYQKFFALWVIANALGWLFGPIPGLATSAVTLQDVAGLLPAYLGQGLLLGVVIGALQALALRVVGGQALSWFAATVIGYALTFPIGLVLFTAIALLRFRDQSNFLAPGAGWIFSPFPAALFLGGFVIAVAQWLVLRPLLARRDRQTLALWVFGLWASSGLSFAFGHWFSTISLGVLPTQTMGLLGYRALTGVVMGVFSGVLLMILMSEKVRTLPRRSRN
jgi:hypothetical protein